MASIKEITRVRKDGRFWVVEVLSPVPGVGFIAQGEHLTKEAADRDRANWL